MFTKYSLHILTSVTESHKLDMTLKFCILYLIVPLRRHYLILTSFFVSYSSVSFFNHLNSI